MNPDPTVASRVSASVSTPEGEGISRSAGPCTAFSDHPADHRQPCDDAECDGGAQFERSHRHGCASAAWNAANVIGGPCAAAICDTARPRALMLSFRARPPAPGGLPGV